MSSSPQDDRETKIKGSLVEPALIPLEETALTMLHARALDARQQTPILEDQWACDITSRLDSDFAGKTGVGAGVSAEITARSRTMDRMTGDFLALRVENGRTPVTVVHLGCGLDTRFLRLRSNYQGPKAQVR